MNAKKIKKAMTTPQPDPDPPPRPYVSTGSTLLNLACTGNSKRGYMQGTVVLMVGDSNTGKTYISLATLAEASVNPDFDDYQLVYNGPENGAQMDIAECFGPKLAQRLVKLDPGEGAASTAEEFYDDADARVARGPCIYILDSMDALSSDDDEEKIEQEREARQKGTKVKGTYGVAKAKINSSRLRTLTFEAAKNGSIIIIIAQTRDTIGAGAMFKPKTRAGGRALKFFSHYEIWLANRGAIKKTYKLNKKEKEVEIGSTTLAKVLRSRATGRKTEVEVPIYYEIGIDDIGSMVDYLVDWGHWDGAEKTVEAPEFGFKGKKEELCRQVDQGGKKRKLQILTAKAWKAVEKAVRIERSNPYGPSDWKPSGKISGVRWTKTSCPPERNRWTRPSKT